MTGRNGNSANTTTGDGPRCQRERASLWQLAGIFLRVGATGFGGMTSLLALIHHYVRDRYNLVDEDEFSEAVAVGQILPGPIVVDAATHIGYTLRGWL
ncbi:MAG: chromate transporter, partial [Armatimonadetes bacterium]|nr:chromate transporter [Armatimonadota bacterium]